MSGKVSNNDQQHNKDRGVYQMTPEQEDRLNQLLAGARIDPFDPLHAQTEIMVDLAVISIDTDQYIKNAPAYVAAIDRLAAELARIEGCGVYALTYMIDQTNEWLTFYKISGGARCTS